MSDLELHLSDTVIRYDVRSANYPKAAVEEVNLKLRVEEQSPMRLSLCVEVKELNPSLIWSFPASETTIKVAKKKKK